MKEMEVKVIVQSNELTKEELRLLLQSISDCKQSSFPDKGISIWFEAPELLASEAREILDSIKPASAGPSIRFTTR